MVAHLYQISCQVQHQASKLDKKLFSMLDYSCKPVNLKCFLYKIYRLFAICLINADCTLISNCLFVSAKLYNVDMKGAMVTGANFRGAKLYGALSKY